METLDLKIYNLMRELGINHYQFVQFMCRRWDSRDYDLSHFEISVKEFNEIMDMING